MTFEELERRYACIERAHRQMNLPVRHRHKQRRTANVRGTVTTADVIDAQDRARQARRDYMATPSQVDQAEWNARALENERRAQNLDRDKRHDSLQ